MFLMDEVASAAQMEGGAPLLLLRERVDVFKTSRLR